MKTKKELVMENKKLLEELEDVQDRLAELEDRICALELNKGYWTPPSSMKAPPVDLTWGQDSTTSSWYYLDDSTYTTTYTIMNDYSISSTATPSSTAVVGIDEDELENTKIVMLGADID